MTIGLFNVLTIFLMVMNIILYDCFDAFMFIYMDDLQICSKEKESQSKQSRCFYLQWNKMICMYLRIEYWLNMTPFLKRKSSGKWCKGWSPTPGQMKHHSLILSVCSDFWKCSVDSCLRLKKALVHWLIWLRNDLGCTSGMNNATSNNSKNGSMSFQWLLFQFNHIFKCFRSYWRKYEISRRDPGSVSRQWKHIVIYFFSKNFLTGEVNYTLNHRELLWS